MLPMGTVQLTLNGEIHYNTYCKWCGKGFNKSYPQNKLLYCSDECRKNAHREQNARSQMKRRIRARNGEIVMSEREKNNHYGEGFLSGHRCKDFDREYQVIQLEMKRLKLKK